MTADAEALEQVVVVGYGAQQRANLTNAVSTIDVQENLEGRPIADVGRAIQGTTPGLSVVVPSGEGGSAPIITIRRQIASLRGEAYPLIARKSDVSGKSVSVRLDLGVRPLLKIKKLHQ